MDELIINTVTIPLDTAAVNREFAFACNYLEVSETSDPSVEVTIQFNSRTGRQFTFTEGRGVRHFPIRRFYLTWAAQPGQTITFTYQGAPQDAQPALFEYFNRSNAQNVSVTSWASSVNANVNQQETRVDELTGAAVQVSKGTGSATYVDVYTVPANKQLRIFRAWWGGQDRATAGAVRIIDGSSTEKSVVDMLYMEGPAPIWENWVIPAGYKIQLKAVNTGVVVSFVAWAQLEDA